MTADVDWRAMFARYIDIVGEAEGVHFLASTEWTEPEWEAIVTLFGEVSVPAGWTPL